MGPLQPRTISVSITTYIATTLVLVLWLLAAVAVALYLFLHQRTYAHRARRDQRTRVFSNTTPYASHNDLTALPSYPQRAQTPSGLARDLPPPSAMTRPIDFSLVRTPPRADLNPLVVPTKTETPGPTTTASPTENRGTTIIVSPAKSSGTATDSPTKSGSTATESPSKNSGTATTASPTRKCPPPFINEATRRRASRANNNPSSNAVNSSRLLPLALASDTTDMSAETFETGTERINEGYMKMLTQKGVPLRDHALLGSDNSTDAGGDGGNGDGAPAALSYAKRVTRARGGGGGASVWGVDAPDPGRYKNRPRLLGAWGGNGRAMTFGQGDGGEEGEKRVRPLQVRKMSSM